MYPGDLQYSESHQWTRVEDGVATVGITHYAQEQLGDIVYVDLPRPDEEAKRGEPLGSVESVKAVADVNSPVSGRVTEVNTDLDDEPEKLLFRQGSPQVHLSPLLFVVCQNRSNQG